MMRAFRLSLTIGCLLVIVGMAFGEIINVPDDYPTIQEAIYNAVNGDTVLVADGTYIGTGNRDIDFGGRTIVVMSENGHEATIIDCQNLGRGFYFHSGEGQLSMVQGFTIKNGSGGGIGGAIFCNNTSPYILQCYFFNNEASVGGGIACDNSAKPIIENCKFNENSGTYGGGIDCDHGSDANIVGCEFSFNTAASGGAIRCAASSDAVISDCIFEFNTASGNGAGINVCVSSSPSIDNCIFRSNSGAKRGGGIYIGSSSTPQIERCLINNNSSL